MRNTNHQGDSYIGKAAMNKIIFPLPPTLSSFLPSGHGFEPACDSSL